MDSKGQQQQTDESANINIDISGGGTANQTDVKNMNLDPNNSARCGLSKDELMKYANQPFWVRLRNILFIGFWIFWLSILSAAIGYVIQSPSCKNPATDAIGAVASTTLASSS